MAIRINRVYTRTGDKGETRLVGGAAVRKDSARVEAYGTVDELNSVLGLARTFNEEAINARPGPGRKARAASKQLDDILKRLQNELFDLGSELATPPGESYPGMIVVDQHPGEIMYLPSGWWHCTYNAPAELGEPTVAVSTASDFGLACANPHRALAIIHLATNSSTDSNRLATLLLFMFSGRRDGICSGGCCRACCSCR